MAFGFGHGTEMVKSVKANRDMLKKRKSNMDLSSFSGIKTGKGSVEPKKMSPDELKEFRMKLMEENRKVRMRNIFILSILIVIIIGILYIVLF